MQVLLEKNVPKLGYRGDVVKVKPGYYRNFLFPRGLATIATDALKKLADKRGEKRLFKKQQLIDNAKEVLKKLNGLVVAVVAKVSSKGKLYGAITEDKVIDAILAEKNIELEKEFIKMSPLKELGEHTVVVRLGEGLEEKVTVMVKSA